MRFFFHVPKTAGGTLGLGIRSNPHVHWPLDCDFPEPDALPSPSARQIWLGGHCAFGLHEVYGAEPFYITVLREPVERLISEFFYTHDHKRPGLFLPHDERIPAFIRHVEAASHLNAYCHLFSDYCFVKEDGEAGMENWEGKVATVFDLLRRRNQRRGFLAENVSFDAVDVSVAYRKASNNIRQFMRFVGFFDRLDETVAYLQSEHGLAVSLEPHIHKTAWMPRAADLPAHIQAVLRRRTEADCELFHSTRRARSGLLAA
jgi:hypothetical protein